MPHIKYTNVYIISGQNSNANVQGKGAYKYALSFWGPISSEPLHRRSSNLYSGSMGHLSTWLCIHFCRTSHPFPEKNESMRKHKMRTYRTRVPISTQQVPHKYAPLKKLTKSQKINSLFDGCCFPPFILHQECKSYFIDSDQRKLFANYTIIHFRSFKDVHERVQNEILSILADCTIFSSYLQPILHKISVPFLISHFSQNFP